MNPPVGGRPIIEIVPIVNAAMVHGILRPIPSSSETLVLCAAV